MEHGVCSVQGRWCRSPRDMKWIQSSQSSSCREGKILTCKPQQCSFQRLEMLSPKSWEPRERSCAFGGKGLDAHNQNWVKYL